MTNKYLEKIASLAYLEKEAGNRYKQHMASKGVNVEGISSASLVQAIPQKPGKPGSFKDIPAVKQNPITKALGMKPKRGPAAPKGNMTKGLAEGLAANKAAVAESIAKGTNKAAVTGAAKPGLMSKVMGMAKKNPLAAGAAAVGTAGAAALGVRAMRGNATSQQYQGGYPQY